MLSFLVVLFVVVLVPLFLFFFFFLFILDFFFFWYDLRKWGKVKFKSFVVIGSYWNGEIRIFSMIKRENWIELAFKLGVIVGHRCFQPDTISFGLSSFIPRLLGYVYVRWQITTDCPVRVAVAVTNIDPLCGATLPNVCPIKKGWSWLFSRINKCCSSSTSKECCNNRITM